MRGRFSPTVPDVFDYLRLLSVVFSFLQLLFSWQILLEEQRLFYKGRVAKVFHLIGRIRSRRSLLEFEESFRGSFESRTSGLRLLVIGRNDSARLSLVQCTTLGR